jgi:hypothetical protein
MSEIDLETAREILVAYHQGELGDAHEAVVDAAIDAVTEAGKEKEAEAG